MVALQLPRSRPAVHAIAPLRCARNAVSANDAAVRPMPV